MSNKIKCYIIPIECVEMLLISDEKLRERGIDSLEFVEETEEEVEAFFTKIAETTAKLPTLKVVSVDWPEMDAMYKEKYNSK